MNVRPIAITTALIEVDGKTPTAEELIIYEARVSAPKNQADLDTAPRLLRYCIRNKHWSIFDQVDLTVEIETSRAIAQQLLRHRSFTFQEFSQRYAEADLGFEIYEARRQDTKNRQNSIDDLPDDIKGSFDWGQRNIQEYAKYRYDLALEQGIAKEQARFLLPLSTTTRLYMKGSVRSWIHYLETRTHWSTQKEHRDLALAIKAIFAQYFPVVASVLEEMEREKVSDEKILAAAKKLLAELKEIKDPDFFDYERALVMFEKEAA